MDLAGIAVVVAVVLVLVGAGVAVLVGRLRSALVAERGATVAALAQQLAADQQRATQATVDTVLAVAGDKLGAHTQHAEHTLDLHGQAFDEKVADVHTELHRLRSLVAELQRDKAEQHGQLVAGLHEAVRASTALSDSTQALREALSNSRARGQWGERMADDVLRSAGFVEGVNYRRQVTLPGGTRPDITFLLPQGRVLHMDVKFPIDNYLRAMDATDDVTRAACTKAFARDVRARVAELADRDYIDPATTVGTVLLFIPNESVYGFVHTHDPGLLDVALARQVVLCSPCTLFAVLAVIRQAVDSFALSRTSDEILQCLTGFTKQWHAFSDKLDRLGQQFTTAQRSYDDLAGTRRRQLQKELDQVERLRTVPAVAPAGRGGRFGSLEQPGRFVPPDPPGGPDQQHDHDHRGPDRGGVATIVGAAGPGSFTEPDGVGGDTTGIDAVDLVDRPVVAAPGEAPVAHPTGASPALSTWRAQGESVA